MVPSPVRPVPPSANPFSAGLADQVMKLYALTSDPADQMLIELAREADHQEELYTIDSPAAIKSTISSRRADIILKLSAVMQERLKRKETQSEARLAANILRVVQQVMNDLHVEPEKMKMIIEGSVERLANGQKDDKRKAG